MAVTVRGSKGERDGNSCLDGALLGLRPALLKCSKTHTPGGGVHKDRLATANVRGRPQSSVDLRQQQRDTQLQTKVKRN